MKHEHRQTHDLGMLEEISAEKRNVTSLYFRIPLSNLTPTYLNDRMQILPSKYWKLDFHLDMKTEKPPPHHKLLLYPHVDSSNINGSCPCVKYISQTHVSNPLFTALHGLSKDPL